VLRRCVSGRCGCVKGGCIEDEESRGVALGEGKRKEFSSTAESTYKARHSYQNTEPYAASCPDRGTGDTSLRPTQSVAALSRLATDDEAILSLKRRAAT
jgi:hypothetical protein